MREKNKVNNTVTEVSLKQSNHYPDTIRVSVNGKTIATAMVLYCGLLYVEKAAIALALTAPYKWHPKRQWEIFRDGRVVWQGEVEMPRG